MSPSSLTPRRRRFPFPRAVGASPLPFPRADGAIDVNTVLKIPPLRAYLQLMRPANIVTAWADILAGFAAAGSSTADWTLVWLILATTGLYGGGVVFNDVFDAELDAKERPERPIPSDRVARSEAIGLGSILLMVGVLAAAQVSLLSTVLAAAIAFAALLYDAYSKHHSLIGPLNMGICRGANLLLGMSAVPAATRQPFLALIPIAYIAAITAISQGEVHGGQSRTGWAALGLLTLVLGSLTALGLLPNYSLLSTFPFILLLAARVLPPFIQATRHPSAEFIQVAVKRGVLSLILLDASLAAGFDGSLAGLLVLALLPLSITLARLFAVT